MYPCRTICRALLIFCVSIAVCIATCEFYQRRHALPHAQWLPKALTDQERPKAIRDRVVFLVVASQRSSNTSWLSNLSSSWEKRIYVMDDPRGEYGLTVPENKGRVSMVYITYVVSGYACGHLVFALTTKRRYL